MDVVTLRWPAEAERRGALAKAGKPRLLVVDGGQQPPDDIGPLEDWIRTPALEIDRVARVEGIRRRLVATGMSAPPEIDENGLVRGNQKWISVPPVEASLYRLLLSRFGAVVSRGELEAEAWPSGDTQRNALDVRILRLRRRLEEVDLVIRTVRSRGYLLEWQ